MKCDSNEVTIILHFGASASTFDKKTSTTISIINTAFALIKYIAQLFFNKAN